MLTHELLSLEKEGRTASYVVAVLYLQHLNQLPFLLSRKQLHHLKQTKLV